MANNESLAAGVLLVGRYEILERIGRGGFGITYKAHDRQNNTPVAIKEYLPEFCAMRGSDGTVLPSEGNEENFAKFRLDFEEEAIALSGLGHPNIVKVYHRFDANGTSYFSMEFVEGETLSALCPPGEPLPTEAVMLLAERLISALIHIHSQQRVHRDIKPGNIIVAAKETTKPSRLPDLPRDIVTKFGNPVLLDFGASRMAPESGSTMTGILTPHFGAPEQSHKRARQDARTDIYGLAATLYSCLAGEHPPSAVERQNEDLLIPAQQRFSNRAPLGFNRALDRALQLRPEYRPKKVSDFRDELFGDLGIEGWSKPASEFDPPGPGLYSGSPSQIPTNNSSPSSANPDDSQPGQNSRMLIGLVGGALLIAGGIGAQSLFQSGEASLQTETPPAANFNARANFEVVARLMQANQSAYNEISLLKVTRNELQMAGGLDQMVSDTNERISQLEKRNNEDKATALQIAEDLAAYARVNWDRYVQQYEELANSVRQEGKTGTANRLDKIHELVITTPESNTSIEERFDQMWSQEVESAQ